MGEQSVITLLDTLLCFLPASSGVYHSSIHSIIPSTLGLSSEQGNEATCQGRRTKRERVEERIRRGEEARGFRGGKSREKKGCRRRGNERDVRMEQGNERGEREGQLSCFIATV